MRLLMFSVVIVILCGGAARADRQSLLERMPNSASLPDPEARILLVRASAVNVTKEELPGGQSEETAVNYRASVLANDVDQPRVGSEVSVHGHLNHVGSLPNNAPVVKQGEVLLLIVKRDADGPGYTYAGEATLPFGLESPCVVAEPQVADVSTALYRFGEVTHGGRGSLTHSQAVDLTRDRNDYVWSIGVIALALEGSPDDARLLSAMYADERMDLRRLLWLDHVSANFLPDALRPSLTLRHQLMVETLQRLGR